MKNLNDVKIENPNDVDVTAVEKINISREAIHLDYQIKMFKHYSELKGYTYVQYIKDNKIVNAFVDIKSGTLVEIDNSFSLILSEGELENMSPKTFEQ
jgi:hypothetical protein